MAHIETNSYIDKESQKSFYITLPSTSANDNVYNSTNFTIDLEKPLDLEGNWTCALTDLSISHSWKTKLQNQYIRIYHSSCQNFDRATPVNESSHATAERKFIDICIDSLDIDNKNKSKIMHDLNGIIKKRLENIHDDHGLFEEGTPRPIGVFDRLDVRDSLVFRYMIHRNNPTFCLKSKFFKIRIPKMLCHVLGFDEDMFDANAEFYIPTMKPFYHPSIDRLYIYTDIVSDSYIGVGHGQIIRSIPVTSRYGGSLHFSFNNLQYFDVISQRIHRISINITDPVGNNLDSKWGTCTIVMHFRKKIF